MPFRGKASFLRLPEKHLLPLIYCEGMERLGRNAAQQKIQISVLEEFWKKGYLCMKVLSDLLVECIWLQLSNSASFFVQVLTTLSLACVTQQLFLLQLPEF